MQGDGKNSISLGLWTRDENMLGETNSSWVVGVGRIGVEVAKRSRGFDTSVVDYEELSGRTTKTEASINSPALRLLPQVGLPDLLPQPHQQLLRAWPWTSHLQGTVLRPPRQKGERNNMVYHASKRQKEVGSSTRHDRTPEDPGRYPKDWEKDEYIRIFDDYDKRPRLLANTGFYGCGGGSSWRSRVSTHPSMRIRNS